MIVCCPHPDKLHNKTGRCQVRCCECESLETALTTPDPLPDLPCCVEAALARLSVQNV